MLSGLFFRLSPARRRFMRRLGRPGLARFEAALRSAGSAQASRLLAPLLGANADYLFYALSADGPLHTYAERATPETIQACMGSLLIFAANLFAHDDMARDKSDLISLIAEIIEAEPKHVMLRRDLLRKSPRSEEWTLYCWLVKDLGSDPPRYDPGLERSFGYQYLSYIGQFRPAWDRMIARPRTH